MTPAQQILESQQRLYDAIGKAIVDFQTEVGTDVKCFHFDRTHLPTPEQPIRFSDFKLVTLLP